MSTETPAKKTQTPNHNPDRKARKRAQTPPPMAMDLSPTGTDAPASPGTDREATIVRTSLVGIVANVVLAAFKAFIGIVSNSIAITLDAVNNLSDALSSVITIVGTKLASKPPDAKHPLGYGRIEYLTSTIISFIVLYAGVTSLVESAKKVIDPEAPDYSVASLVIIASAVLVKLVLGRYVRGVGQKVGSDSLVASGSDALFDAILSTSTLAAAIIYLTTGLSLEALVGVVISVFIVKAGWEMLGESLSQILGEGMDPNLALEVKEAACQVEGVYAAYDTFLHAYGPQLYVCDMHVEVDDRLMAGQIDEITRCIQALVYQKTEGKVIVAAVGIYARCNTGRSAEMRNQVTRLVMAHPSVLQMHAFHLDEARKLVTFDLVIDFGADRAHEYQRIVDEVRKAYPDYRFQVTLDIDSANLRSQLGQEKLLQTRQFLERGEKTA